MTMPFSYTCLTCGKKVFVQAADKDEAQRFAGREGWWFELGSDDPVCSIECAADLNRKRSLEKKN